MGKYFCNPLNIDYRYQFHVEGPKGPKAVAREAADPSLILFHGKYYLFASMTLGVWVSDDLVDWTFSPLPEDFPVYDYAPDARVMGDYVYLCASALGRECDYYRTKDIEHGPYERIPGTFPFWDPNLFVDDDGRVYFYWGCSSVTPLWGVELDPATLKPLGEKVVVLRSDPFTYGYERNGDDNSLTPRSDEDVEELMRQTCAAKGLDMDALPPDMLEMGRGYLRNTPYIEGAWVTKHGGKYYLQYAITGTQYNVYADGVAVSDSPLGPYTKAADNPYSLKVGGFLEGAGHGSTLEDKAGGWWHAATMRLSVNQVFERRLGLWPAGFDADGALFCNQRFGDWPVDVEEVRRDPWAAPQWMLLSYHAAAKASSAAPDHGPELATDENVRTWWKADAAAPGQWLELDLGGEMTIHAVQMNFADDHLDIPAPGPANEEAARYIDVDPRVTRWVLEVSADGKTYETLADKSQADTCLPHDLIVREDGVNARYVRLTVLEVPFGVEPCVSGLRVFGNAGGDAPKAPQFTVRREGDLDATVTIALGDGAEGHLILWGSDPHKLYHSKLTYQGEAKITSLIQGQKTFVRVDGFNKSGITAGETVLEL